MWVYLNNNIIYFQNFFQNSKRLKVITIQFFHWEERFILMKRNETMKNRKHRKYEETWEKGGRVFMESVSDWHDKDFSTKMDQPWHAGPLTRCVLGTPSSPFPYFPYFILFYFNFWQWIHKGDKKCLPPPSIFHSFQLAHVISTSMEWCIHCISSFLPGKSGIILEIIIIIIFTRAESNSEKYI